MPRPLRRYHPGTVIEVTSRTDEGLFALTPTRPFVRELVGILWKACQEFGVLIHDFWFGSNHFHLLLSASGSDHLSAWMAYIHTNTTKLAQRVHGITRRLWPRRYTAIEVLDDDALASRVRYLWDQATGANLCARPGDWPGLNAVDFLTRGIPVEGYHATADDRRRAKRRNVPLEEVATPCRLPIAPLPSMADLSPGARQSWYRRLERSVIQDTARRHAQAGTRPRDPTEIPKQNPHLQIKLERTPRPPCHASERSTREQWCSSYRAFVDAWRRAMFNWQTGKPRAEAGFPPEGCMPLHRQPFRPRGFKQAA